MFSGKYGNGLTVILVVVIILILGLVGYFAYNMYVQNTTNNKANLALEEFEKETIRRVKKDSDNEDGQLDLIESEGSGTKGSKKTYLEGYEIKGKIEIPKIDVAYPVLSEVTKKSLEAAVAILYGPGLNEVGNTVILGHNYRNKIFFSNLDKLVNGDSIYITDQSGAKIEYEVYKIYETDPDDAEYMLRDTENKREISLSSCTDDGKGRIIVWAKEK